MLFSIDARHCDVEVVIRSFWLEFDAEPEGREYADELVRGVYESLDKVDERIRQASTNWRIERMARVDRNLLRMAAYELLNCETVPRAVIIDEAVELAKLFGTEDSSSFVNGVLDRIAEDAGRVDIDR